MGQVVKMYMGLFFILLQALVGMGVVTAGIETGAAQNYHRDVIDEIECSNFNAEVMSACIQQAENMGYQLSIQPMVYDEEQQIQTAEVILKYNYAIQVLQMQSTRQVRGFAR